MSLQKLFPNDPGICAILDFFLDNSNKWYYFRELCSTHIPEYSLRKYLRPLTDMGILERKKIAGQGGCIGYKLVSNKTTIALGILKEELK